MVDEQAYQEARAVVRRSLGPCAALARGRVRVLAAHLADGEEVEAVVVGTAGLLRGYLVAATASRLIVVGERRRVRSVAWAEVSEVQFGPRRAVIRTPGDDLVLGSVAPELGLRVISERASGGPGRVAGACAVLAAVFGRSAWLYRENLVRVLDELMPGEVVVDLVEAGTYSGLVVLTDRRVGLVPSRRGPASAWVAFAHVRRVIVRGWHVVVVDRAGAVFDTEVRPSDSAHTFADRVAASSGAAFVADDRTDDEDGEGDEWEDAAAGSRAEPSPSEGAVVQRAPERFTIVPDDYHVPYAGTAEDGRKFFLSDELFVADGSAYIGVFLWNPDGTFDEIRVDAIDRPHGLPPGQAGRPEAADAKDLVAARLAELGDYVLEPIEVEPFTRDVDGVTFGWMVDQYDDGTYFINIEPGDFIAYYEPWDGLEYDT